ncbi:MAG: endonuclease/exonuclease/phosphatase family protein [Phycisphaerales bacterium]|nr:endonuclease/exonuclease/phosphatase family protein [Phycisphaerales bacterium]
MKHHNMRAAGMIGMIGAISAIAGSAAAQINVSKTGVFDPDGTLSNPFSVVHAALCAAPNNADLRINGGIYRETGAFTQPASLTGANGEVVIGQLGAQRTTLSVLTYNTHLFGDQLLGAETYMDAERTGYIGEVLATEQADIVGLQECWDSELWIPLLIRLSFEGYTGFYGDQRDDDLDVLHSGLAIHAKGVLQHTQQGFFGSERGEDAFASKGFLSATIEKDGFRIAVFNTHTQAGDGEANEEVRFEQMLQLGFTVQGWRFANPSDVVIVMGDFNVPGETGEYSAFMAGAMAVSGTREGGPNFHCSADSFACTSCAENELKQYFGGSGSKRLDYILYAPSFDGSVDIVPVALERREYQVPAGEPDLCDNGWCIRDLSDHYGLLMQFELNRN